jgi:hypothetical protein
MSFGAYSPLYRLVAHVPLLNVFRFPCRYLCLFEFAAAVFAAIGFLLLLRQSQLASEAGPCDQEDAVDREDAITWGSFEPLWVLVAVACAVAVAGVKLRYEPYIGSVPAILVGPILYLLAVLLVITAARGRRFALIGLILLAAADQGFYGMSYSVYPRNAKLDEYVASAETPPDAADGRVLATLFRCDEPGLRTGNRMTLSGWRRADGYAGLEPRRRLDYRELAALRVAGVRWVRQGPTTKDIAGLRPFNENWSEVPDPLPRARLVARTQVSDAPARDLLGISPEETALTETPVSILPSEPGKTSVLSDRPGLLQIETECPQPQLLVVSESYHPGWQAEVNGQSQRVHRVNGDFVGCVVEAGKSQVVLEFRPQSLEWGWIASLAGMGMASLCLVGSVFSETSFQTKE